MKKTTATTVGGYNKLQIKSVKEVCNILAETINSVLKKSESKIWHGSPVWFLDGNPVVAYSVRKDGRVSLMFFSGQSFKTKGLISEGKFKAAEVFYTNVKEVKITLLKKWLKESKEIQWDYKNIIKNKGRLTLIPNTHRNYNYPKMQQRIKRSEKEINSGLGLRGNLDDLEKLV